MLTHRTAVARLSSTYNEARIDGRRALMSLLSFCEWLASTPGSIALIESQYMYSVVESIHVITLALFLGTLSIVDLRMLGLALRRVPVGQVASALLPWT